MQCNMQNVPNMQEKSICKICKIICTILCKIWDIIHIICIICNYNQYAKYAMKLCLSLIFWNQKQMTMTPSSSNDQRWSEAIPFGAIPTRGMGRKAIISLDEDEGTTPTRTWVKEMNSNENFCRNEESNGNSSDLRGKVDSFLRDGNSK